jgi:5'-phosphate synthase pdxT subunit
MARLGVLALQGGFEAHVRGYADLGVEAVEVRRVAELSELDGLVLPGGESTTLLKLMRYEPWFDAFRGFHDAGKAIFGTCAGAILLAREVLDPVQDSVGLLDATIRRNGFGRQIDSFETDLEVEGEERPVRAVFIRAPRFSALGPAVEVLARFDDEPVLVREGNVMAATFHPELTDDRCLHRRFLTMANNPLRLRAPRAIAG